MAVETQSIPVDANDEFRAEVQSWLNRHAPQSLRGMRLAMGEGSWGGRHPEFSSTDAKYWMEAMVERGWTAPTWPQEYGGGGLSRQQAKILQEELDAIRMPPALIGLGLMMVGPTILEFGTAAQKQEHIPAIVRGEIRWCQGYSEPGAGSDLASLRTSAVRDGDHFIVSGQKIWTSYADKSDWIFALVRTDPTAPKQAGISFLLIDMASPGVTVKPIELISGASAFCETFFDDVRVPVTNMLGEENQGWTVAKSLLGHEREVWGGSGGASGRKKRSAVAEFARQYRPSPNGRIGDPNIRASVAQLEIDTLALTLTAQRGRDAAKVGRRPGEEMSLLKYYGAETAKRRFDLMMDIAGTSALGWDDETLPADMASLTEDWLRSRANSIEGGTSETQLNIIAKRVLRLPMKG